MKRSESPPTVAENAIDLPSGDHVGFRISPTSGTSISRDDVAVGDVENREHRLAGVHAADDELAAVGAPRSGRADELQAREVRAQRRVDELAHDAPGRRVSARYRSIENRSRDEKKTMWRPSGLIDGDTLVAIRVLSFAGERRARRCARARSRPSRARTARGCRRASWSRALCRR